MLEICKFCFNSIKILSDDAFFCENNPLLLEIEIQFLQLCLLIIPGPILSPALEHANEVGLLNTGILAGTGIRRSELKN